MEVECIPFKKTGYFSNLICDYLDGKETLSPFYDRPPQIDQFAEQIKAKQNFPSSHREVLYSVLKNQYRDVDTSEDTKVNISLLKEASTYTVVTGHQLNLFTGPLYFLYKIISTINLTKELKLANPENNFVPIYWMAT
ncbi:MAG: bacillithiol biosynthesis BshC, partial [Arenibacter troitsensis]|nr:bacillithiol biosynthesis BshC [Arenibacter troitsensis]